MGQEKIVAAAFQIVLGVGGIIVALMEANNLAEQKRIR